jgi:hypothetical protein
MLVYGLDARLLPKRGLRLARPIVNMGRKWAVVTTKGDQKVTTLSVNAALAKPFAVLTGSKREQPALMGASVFLLLSLPLCCFPFLRLLSWCSAPRKQ